MQLSVHLLAGLAATLRAQIEMDRLMDLKIKHWDSMRAAGAFDKYDNARLAAVGPTPCVNGKAGEYSCEKVDLFSFLSHAQMGSATKEGNDVWGKQSQGYSDWAILTFLRMDLS